MRVDHVAYQRASRVSVLGLLLQLATGLLLLGAALYLLIWWRHPAK